MALLLEHSLLWGVAVEVVLIGTAPDQTKLKVFRNAILRDHLNVPGGEKGGTCDGDGLRGRQIRRVFGSRIALEPWRVAGFDCQDVSGDGEKMVVMGWNAQVRRMKWVMDQENVGLRELAVRTAA